MKPDVSVVILSDYAAGEATTYSGLRTALQQLAEQTFTGEAEFIVVESERFRHRLPGDLTTILPTLRILLAEGQDSFALRNVGTQLAAADIVAFLDADCVPECDWLHWLVAALAHPSSSGARNMVERRSKSSTPSCCKAQRANTN